MYLVIISNFHELVIDKRTRDKTVKAMAKGDSEYIYINDSFIKLTAIMGIVSMADTQQAKDLKSGKNHPKYKSYLREKNNYNFKGSFDSYLNAIDYKSKEAVKV